MVDVLPAVYAAITGNSSITALLGTWNTNTSVFTKRPVPERASYPMIIINPPFSITNPEDALVERRPLISLDIAVYGEQEKHYRDVDAVAFLIRNQFHRIRTALTVSGYVVYEIVTTGPIPAPADDEEHIGRAVTLNIKLQPE